MQRDEVKVINVRHVGLNVPDLEAAKKFYVSLGAEFCSQDTEKGPFIEGLLNYEGIRLLTCKLRFLDGSRLELIQILMPENDIYAGRKKVEIFQLGLHHLAFTVPDINRTIDVITKLGGQLLSLPQKNDRDHSNHAVPAIHAYCWDPFGNLLHIAQDI